MTAVLVTGATGKQGGSLIKSLIAKNAPFEILAVTRDAQSPSAQRLAALSSNIKLVEGNLDDPAAIFQNARKVTDNPIWGVFSVQVAIGNGAQEEPQGKALVDESLKQNVKMFVYSSVDRGGNLASFNNPTRIPHFVKKHNIEHHLVDKVKEENPQETTQMRWCILRPVAFYENLEPTFFGKVFPTCYKMVLEEKPLQMVATSDIGWFAAEAFLHPEAYAGKGLSLAGDELTYAQFEKIFEQKTGQAMPTTYRFICSLILTFVKDFGYMFQWFRDEGYKADIAELRRMNPELKDFGTWLETESEFRKR